MTASHEDQRPDDRSPAGVGTHASGVVPRRRRLIRVGLYAAPVLSSLAGRSALGACYSPYAHFSGNVSSHPEYEKCTSGKSASCYILCTSKSFWTTASVSFPSFASCSGDPRPIKCNEFNPGSTLGKSPYSLSASTLNSLSTGCNNSSGNTITNGAWGTQFGTIFGFSGISTDLEKSPLWLVLAFPSAYGAVGNLAAQLVAAYINSMQPSSGYPLKPQDVKDMWTARATGWCPSAYKTCPTTWNASQILAYLQEINTVAC